MNENLDLTKILEGCPEGTKFYSTVYGEVTFVGTQSSEFYPIRFKGHSKRGELSIISYVTKDGRWDYNYDGECTLFPSKDQRDWSKFERFWDKPKVERFVPKTLKPFDMVLVRDSDDERWRAMFFSHMDDYLNIHRAVCGEVSWGQCIPYNEETIYIVGSKEGCPEYYKWWEE